ncbi:MAG TPA: hypothetical protein VKY37_04245 [Brumimicrobium sp.]|nr:hypothetical protein [Brumimicrobium sp.]
MKNIKLLIGSLLFISLTMTSCGGDTIQSDAKKMAELHCESMSLMEKVIAGDEDAMLDIEKLGEKAGGFEKEIKGKYTEKSEQEAFAKAFAKEIEKCN